MKKLLLFLLICSTSAVAQKAAKKGIAYKQHRYIDIVKQLAVLYEKGDTNAMAAAYADTARLVGMGRYEPANSGKFAQQQGESVLEAKAGWKKTIDNWQNIKMIAIEDPEGFEYAGSPFEVHSSWKLTLVNKKTKKTAYVEMVLFDWFNKDGKIAYQTEYYDPSPLIAAMQ